MKPFTRRGWLKERADLYERLARAEEYAISARLRWDGAEGRYRDAVAGVWALADLVEQHRNERNASDAALREVRTRCRELIALRGDRVDEDAQDRAAVEVARDVLKVIDDDTGDLEAATPGGETDG